MISRTDFTGGSSYDRGSFAASSRGNSFANALASIGDKGPAFISKATLPPASSARMFQGEQVADASGSFIGARGEVVSVDPGTLRVNGPGRSSSGLRITDRETALKQIDATFERTRAQLTSASQADQTARNPNGVSEFDRLKSRLEGATARENTARYGTAPKVDEFTRLKTALETASAKESAARHGSTAPKVDEFTRLKTTLEGATSRENSARYGISSAPQDEFTRLKNVLEAASAREAEARGNSAAFSEAALAGAPEAALRSGSLYSEMAVRQTSDAITDEEAPKQDTYTVASADSSGSSTDERG
ncbi:MAG: hypothetical protein ACRCWO_07235 [Bosea sp. (in: a-proteobacteria)]